MPTTKSAAKALRQTKKVTMRNIKVKDDVKTLLKKIRKAVAAKQETAKTEEMLRQAQKMLDKAVKRGVIKKNTGARKLSRIVLHSRKINKSDSK